MAIDDLGCTLISLAAATYEESLNISRSLSLAGAGSSPTTLTGQVAISGAGTVATLTDLTVDTSTPALAGCFLEAVSVRDGARLEGRNLDVRQASGAGNDCPALPLFADGFESGDTSAWSATVP